MRFLTFLIKVSSLKAATYVHTSATTRQTGKRERDNLEGDHVEATTWKRQRGSDNVEATTWKRQRGSDNVEATTWKRQSGSDNLEGGVGGGEEETKMKIQKYNTAIVLPQSPPLISGRVPQYSPPPPPPLFSTRQHGSDKVEATTWKRQLVTLIGFRTKMVKKC